MKKFLIAGSIVNTDADKETFEDVTPVQVNAFLKTLEKDEEAVIEINSWGGDVSAALAICNLLKQASLDGHKTTSHIIGVAASSASLIACACDKLTIDSNAFIVVHNPWSATVGNANDYRKEAENLDKFRDAMLAIYRTKFDTPDEIIKTLLDDETWILGEQIDTYKLNGEVIPVQEQLKVLAKYTSGLKFAKIPKVIGQLIYKDLTTESNIEDMENENKEIEKEVEETPVATETEEKPVEEMVAKAEVEKRVSGMQSKMAKQMDAMKKDYEAKLADFEVQIKAKVEELTRAKAEVISLNEKLENTNKELSEMTSAFEEKSHALATLNASVNTPKETTDWRNLKGKQFFDWYAKNH